MTSSIQGATRSYQVAVALAKFVRVKLDGAGKVVIAVLADNNWIGTTETKTFAADDLVSVRLRTAEGTKKMVSSEALVAGDEVFTAAAGKVGKTASGAFHVGICQSLSTADGDIVEVLETHSPVVVP